MAQRVFVVDDLPDFLELMEDVLSLEGYAVRTFPSATEAARAARDNAPNLIITDLRLGAESGFDLVETLRADPATSDVPILLCTAATMDIEEQAGMVEGAGVSVLYKPFEMGDLLARVRGLLQGSLQA
jgi:DNA-binding response OmpR family regulator